MAVPQHHVFAREDVIPSWWANAQMQALGTLAHGFTLRRATTTTIEVPAGAGDLAAVIAVDGKWRWNEATVNRIHPGGAAGLYRVWVTALENDIINVPDPGTDVTDYAFDLAITAVGVEPAIVPGTVEIFREVGSIRWDGDEIVAVTPFVGAIPMFSSGPYASRPLANQVPAGYVYSETDVTSLLGNARGGVYVSDGTRWHTAKAPLYDVWADIEASQRAEGNEIIYQPIDDASDACYWHLRWRQDSFQWACCGGIPWSTVTTLGGGLGDSDVVATTGAWADVTEGGTQIGLTLPTSGVYMQGISVRRIQTSAPMNVELGLKSGAPDPFGGNGPYVGPMELHSDDSYDPSLWFQARQSCAEGQIRMRIKKDLAGNIWVTDPVVWVLPVQLDPA
jgi:hypothetical protein